MFAVLLVFLSRLALVLLFLPFSAWDKVVNFPGAVGQAREIGVGRVAGGAMILAGLAVEVVGSLAVLTGIADRLAALVLAFYCVATAVLYKRWWRMNGGVFRPGGDSRRRETFFDFWKNLAVAGGFAAIAFGTAASGQPSLLDAPFASSDPYAMATGR